MHFLKLYVRNASFSMLSKICTKRMYMPNVIEMRRKMWAAAHKMDTEFILKLLKVAIDEVYTFLKICTNYLCSCMLHKNVIFKYL